MVTLIILVLLIILVMFMMEPKKKPGDYDYKCFLLTVKDQKERQERFYKSHREEIPIETIYGPDTRIVKIASEYEDIVDPEYYEKAIEMHYTPDIKRPDITYFNLGAIGCFVGHMEFYDRCFKQGLKYAVIFEDNVIVKSNQLYDEIQKVIDEKGDDFEMCFFHCLSRLPDEKEGTLEKVKWISSTKCYLVNVENMKKYKRHFYPMDNHVDMKHEDLIAKGARVYYKDMREHMLIDRTHKSLIGHSDHGKREFFSRQFPDATPDDVKWGY
jgi:GR25 family glycosyltransferase involved in LPS biosynthesis